MDTVHKCDRRMDRITVTKTVQRRASHGKNRRKQQTRQTRTHSTHSLSNSYETELVQNATADFYNSNTFSLNYPLPFITQCTVHISFNPASWQSIKCVESVCPFIAQFRISEVGPRNLDRSTCRFVTIGLGRGVQRHPGDAKCVTEILGGQK